MRAFLKSLDECVWMTVEKSWTKPTPTNIDMWTKDELNTYDWNSKKLHATFMDVSKGEFKRISMCETAKNARDILEVIDEGTKIVENSKF